MQLPAENFKHFNAILIVPDQSVKIHTRQMMKMIFDLGFKNLFVHQESVLSTFAMAIPSAVVVDLGATKTSVCCIEEGVIISKSMIRKNFGGNDQTTLMNRILQRDKPELVFDRDTGLSLLNDDYGYHKQLIEQQKERMSTNMMSTVEPFQPMALTVKEYGASTTNKCK
mmetsp:Transcript_10274/g.15635  ORF Transcript_10274/g.15635 Transcript_10274/m.15635 type:complete len:169 (+) Transcript_10274:834-1340(+)